MKALSHYGLLHFCGLFIIYAIGLLLFTRGFLLKRLEVADQSGCHASSVSVTSAVTDRGQATGTGCWLPKKFSRTILIIIDALRYDFAKYNDTLTDTDSNAFNNKLKIFHELETHYPMNTLLVPFYADPPTTTMQRLKGLTTGSLPTFVDAGSNFAGAEIVEDNILEQMKKSAKRVVHMGDDTWKDLFPDDFHRTFPYPSFNVKDLHTVDNGVLEHLSPELEKPDWDMIIAHFLGVDHCGHRYGPYHPAMAEKLTQMDGVIRSVVKQMSPDTILFVLGDHGMTKTGDHGGDSFDELNAALFIYSPRPIINQQQARKAAKKSAQTVSQVDLVPTLSLLMGIPIPFSNLGAVIPQLFQVCTECDSKSVKTEELTGLVRALQVNAAQVFRYLQTYANISHEFPKAKFDELVSDFHAAEKTAIDLFKQIKSTGEMDADMIGKLETLRQSYTRFLSRSKEMCHDIWAKFDIPTMTLGTSILILCVMQNLYIIIHLEKSLSPTGNIVHIFAAVSFLLSFVLLYCGFEFAFYILLGLCAINLFVVCANYFDRYLLNPDQKLLHIAKPKSMLNTFATVFLILYCGSYFSNSFTVYEDACVSFLLQSLTGIYFCYIIGKLFRPETKDKEQTGSQKKTRVGFDLGRLITAPITLCAAIFLLLNCSVKISHIFRGCREEQWTCQVSSFLQPLSSLTSNMKHYKNLRYFLSITCVAATVIMFRKFLRHHGNLNGFSVNVICAQIGVPLTGIVIALYWAMQTLPQQILDSLPHWQLVIFPRVVYAISLLSLTVIIIQPLCIYLRDQPDSKDALLPHQTSEDKLVPELYNHLKLHWRSHLTQNGLVGREGKMRKKPPVVYGLATVYSAAIIFIIISVTMVLFLLLGDGLAASVVMQLITMVTFLEIHATHIRLTTKRRDNPHTCVRWSAVVAWMMIGSHFFFATGHQATIPSIKWDAAFVGFHGDFEKYLYPVAAALITMNTFASHILALLGLPLLIFWPMVQGKFIFRYEDYASRDEESERKGEFILQESGPELRSSLIKMYSMYVLVYGMKALGALGAAFLHRRHLMVWKIFAPRFVLEGATFLLVAALSPLCYLLVMRIHGALNRWVDKLEEEQAQ